MEQRKFRIEAGRPEQMRGVETALLEKGFRQAPEQVHSAFLVPGQYAKRELVEDADSLRGISPSTILIWRE